MEQEATDLLRSWKTGNFADIQWIVRNPGNTKSVEVKSPLNGLF